MLKNLFRLFQPVQPVKATRKPRALSKKREAIQGRLTALGLSLEATGGQWRVYRLDPVHGKVEITYCPNLAAVGAELARRENSRALV